MTNLHIPQFFKTLQLIFLALITGQVLFGGTIWWLLSQQEGAGESRLLGGNSVLALIILTWMIISAFLLYRKRAERAATLPDLASRLAHYRTSSIFRWAMLELGNMLVIIICFIDRNPKLMLFFALGMGVFLLTRPSAGKFAEEYQITGEEREQLFAS